MAANLKIRVFAYVILFIMRPRLQQLSPPLTLLISSITVTVTNFTTSTTSSTVRYSRLPPLRLKILFCKFEINFFSHFNSSKMNQVINCLSYRNGDQNTPATIVMAPSRGMSMPILLDRVRSNYQLTNGLLYCIEKFN